jgi:hypothetical protein
MKLQPHHLQDDLVQLVPLREEHFEDLYQAASDPLVWEQHPLKDRCQRDVFRRFFDDVLSSSTEPIGGGVFN